MAAQVALMTFQVHLYSIQAAEAAVVIQERLLPLVVQVSEQTEQVLMMRQQHQRQIVAEVEEVHLEMELQRLRLELVV
jgi:predicted aspartyl protease